MDKKIRVYFCTGCGIGDAVDVADLQKTAKKTSKNAAETRSHEMLCSPEGRAMIESDIANDGVNAVLVAACSPRVHQNTFHFGPSTIVDRIALREHVAYVLPAGEEDTQMAADDYVRMGVTKIMKTEPMDPAVTDVQASILVVGGGVTGLSAALETARAGVRVVLVEKQEKLGGWVASWGRKFPTRPPYRDLVDNDIVNTIEAVEKHPLITVYKAASVLSISGQPGEFDVRIRVGNDEKKETIGAIVQATGWRPYDATKLTHLGYGKSKDVITHVELEEMLSKTGKLVRPSNGAVPRSVVFVQCAGSRDPNHLPYCSAVCCRTSLKQARVIRELYPDTGVTLLYKDVRTPGQYELFYKNAQDDPGVFLVKGEVTGVAVDQKTMTVSMTDSLLGDAVEVGADLVVLAVGMTPVSEEPILNLQYRRGGELPVGKYAFPDSDFICFPYETQRTGIYAAGCVREPMDSDACSEDAAGASLKAIQCIACTARGAAVHPRAGDLTYPEFFLSRCTQCKRCTEECPFGTLDEDEKGTPKPNPGRCRRCGVCMGACPERIISFKNYSVDMIGSMIKAIEVPEEDEEKPRYVAFVCENDIIPALDLSSSLRKKISPWVRFVSLRCLGSTNLQWINDSLIKGIDGVMLIGCKSGEDYQCHFIKGSELCGVRMSKIQETLTRLALEPERIAVKEFSMGDWESLPDWINEFVDKTNELGPNPNKGF
ncbi:MAG TPA: FAD-dependent oxidoreductase [Polyangiaceae bacterium]|jgi:quinone-modifying oxidoreductase subunit QmoB|nr:FAD-dependent oxidoreductase [Polyangiaceae bacterium]HNZ24795.1 FAD-dependent oxidoreductase [Polyangiaceae bacterium]HOD22011.1 FAD-dependent oxidoreductase [Polyangiaceae bacterium]HOE47977.1 FAD-dependent oxidoreductase [Polyangiaceae bacterium]HOH02893.1 FAD-dependent oxidoreductase [Polyangiaceae bacterium]